MPKRKKHKTKVKILEATNESGLTKVQRQAIDQSEHVVFQFPFMNHEIQGVLNMVKNRQIKPEIIPSNFPSTHKAILQSVYKRKNKPAYFVAIEDTSYQAHLRDTLIPSLESFTEAEDMFYFGTLEETIQASKKAFESFVSYKQGIEMQVMQDITDISNKILSQNPSNICYLTQGESPQITDSLYRWYTERENTQTYIQKPFTLDFRTETYRKFTNKKLENEDYTLNNLDYLKLVLFHTLLNLGMNEIDFPTENFKLESPWLNQTRNHIINSFSFTDIQKLHLEHQDHWFGWNKSTIITKEFEKRYPRQKQASFVLAQKYLQSGFNIIQEADPK